MRSLPFWFFGSFFSLSLFFIYAFFLETRRFRIRRYALPLKGDDRGTLTLLHLSDLHIRGRERKKMAFLRELGQKEVDLVLITGDLIEMDEGIPSCVEALKALKSKYGIYVVLGGHDYYDYRPGDIMKDFIHGGRNRTRGLNSTQKLISSLRETGVKVLINENLSLSLNGMTLTIVGVDDPYFQRDDLPRALKGAEDGALKILLSHALEEIDEPVKQGFNLVLAGHTHGGQVRLPFLGALLTRCNLPRQYASGLFQRNGTFFHISQGLGTGRFTNFRFLCPPEATFIHLTGEGKETQHQGTTDKRLTTGKRLRLWCWAGIMTLFLFSTALLMREVSQALRGILSERGLSIAVTSLYSLLGMGILLYLIFFLQERNRGTYIAFCALIFIYIYSLYPIPTPEERMHFLMYGLLALLVHRALKVDIKGRYSYYWSVVVVSLVGLAEEIFLHFLHQRVFDLRDVVINGLGSCLALFLKGFVLCRKESLHEMKKEKIGSSWSHQR